METAMATHFQNSAALWTCKMLPKSRKTYVLSVKGLSWIQLVKTLFMRLVSKRNGDENASLVFIFQLNLRLDSKQLNQTISRITDWLECTWMIWTYRHTSDWSEPHTWWSRVLSEYSGSRFSFISEMCNKNVVLLLKWNVWGRRFPWTFSLLQLVVWSICLKTASEINPH